MFLFLRSPPSNVYASDDFLSHLDRKNENIPLYFHSRRIRNRLIDTSLRLFCIFNYDRAQFILQLSSHRIANLQINRDFYPIDSNFFLRSMSFEFAFTNESIQEQDVIVRWKNGGVKLMAHKRVRSNRARRIVNFRRFDVASVSAFRGGGEEGRAGLSQRSRARNSAGSFVQVGWERARQWIHTCTISTKLENIYEASRKMNEKSVAKALWSSVLCSSGTRQTFLQRDVVSSRF